MRILYDTNILVTILARRQAILAFKKDMLENHIDIISSQHILSEVEAVLVEKMKLTKQKAKTATRLLERQSTLVTPKTIERVCRDPFDDYVLAAAVEGRVEYLVTEDQDLLVLKQYSSIKIVRYAEFREIVDK